MGQSRTAQVQKDARIGEAEARRDAGMAEAEAEMQRMEAKLANDTEIARAKRDFDLKKATYDVEVNTARAEAEKAYELQVYTFSKYVISVAGYISYSLNRVILILIISNFVSGCNCSAKN